MKDVLMDLSFCYIALPSVETVMPISKAATMLSSSYPNSRVSAAKKVSWRKKSKLHTTLPSSTLSSTVSWICQGVLVCS